MRWPEGSLVRQATATPYGINLACDTKPGVGENWLARGGGGGGVGAPFPDPPPLLGSRDGALKKVIDGGK